MGKNQGKPWENHEKIGIPWENLLNDESFLKKWMAEWETELRIGKTRENMELNG